MLNIYKSWNASLSAPGGHNEPGSLEAASGESHLELTLGDCFIQIEHDAGKCGPGSQFWLI